MTNGWDLDDNCWRPRSGSIAPGDVFLAPAPELESTLHVAPDTDEVAFIAVRFSHALVTSRFRSWVVLVPIILRANVEDQDAFDAATEEAREAERTLRLPELYGRWDGDALVPLFRPFTLTADILTSYPNEHMASMTDDDGEKVARRFARAFS
jgi:hypothetical protein